MTLKEFLAQLPEAFAHEIMESLPAPDRKDLLRRHGARVKVRPGSLKRAARAQKECRSLLQALRASDDPDEGRSFLQGWLAHRAEMVVAFLDAWEVEHQNGIVEDFDWVGDLEPSQVEESLEKVDVSQWEPVAPLVYFAYIELPCTEAVLDVPGLWRTVEAGSSTAADS